MCTAVLLHQVVEGVLVFLNCQHSPSRAGRSRQHDHKLSVTMDIVPTNDATTHKLKIQVLACGLGPYFLDGGAFIKLLCDYGTLCPGVGAESGSGEEVMEVVSRSIGQPGQVRRHRLMSWSCSESVSPLIEESLVTRPPTLHPADLLVTLSIFERDFHALSKILLKHLRMVHLVNPEVTLSLLVRDPLLKPTLQVLLAKTCTDVAHRPPVHLILSPHHYTTQLFSPGLGRSGLVKGETLTLHGDSLRLCSLVSTLPGLRLRRGRKLPLNKLCHHISIFVYAGPHMLPLVGPGSVPGFPLSLLADWGSYGCSLSPSSSLLPEDDLVSPSYTCNVTNVREPSSHTPSHTLLLFLFLEDPTHSDKTQLSENIRWRQGMESVHKLREGFQDLVVTQSKKFHQSIHSALNKVACNYSSHSKTRAIMSSSLPLLAEAVTSIVTHSNEETFRASCLDVLQLDSVDAVRDNVEQRLWRVAKKKLSITHPTGTAANNPDEPTSPELAAALGVGGESGGATVTTPTSSSIEGATGRPLSVYSTSPQSSLPRAGVKQPLHREEQEMSTNTTHSCNSQDDECFESLCELSENIDTSSQDNKCLSECARTGGEPPGGGVPTLPVAALPLLEAANNDSDEEWDCLLTQQSIDNFELLGDNENMFEVCSDDFEWT